MSLLFLPLGLLVWVICYGPVTGEPDSDRQRDPHRFAGWTGCHSRR